MSTQHAVSTSPSSTTAPFRSDPDGTRTLARAVAAVTSLGALAVVAVLVWRPWVDRNAFGYGDIAPHRNAIWAGSLIDGLGFALAAIGLGIAACWLAQGRGRGLAVPGALLTAAGGITFAMGSTAFAAAGWLATSDAIPEKAGRALLHTVGSEGSQLFVPAAVGFLVTTLGSLLIAAALLRARTIPTWIPVALIVLTLAQFVPLPSRALDLVEMGATLTFALVAVSMARRVSEPA
jgi:hypothetical protein